MPETDSRPRSETLSARAADLPGFAATSRFARVLRQRLQDYSRAIGGNRFANGTQWAMTGIAAAGFVSAYGLLLSNGPAAPAWLSLSLVAAAAFSSFMLLVLIGHDAAHGSASRVKRLNDSVLFSVFAINGVSGALWRDRHLRLHHSRPNVPGTGIDADASSLVRLAPDKPWRWYHRFQPVYAFALYFIGHAAVIWIEDFIEFGRMRRQNPAQFAGTRSLAAFAATKAIHLGLFAALPLAAGFPILAVAVAYFLATGLISIAFALLVIGTHVSDRAEFPLPDSDGRLPHDWATLQILTSVDWAPLSPLAAALTGGANAHTAHHLFPAYAHSHATALARIVVEAAREAGIAYRSTSLAGMVAGHLRHLKALASPAR